MGKLTEGNRTARELVTEILDKTVWWKTLKVIVQALRAKGVEQVRLEFGFVYSATLKETRRAPSHVVPIGDLESSIKKGLDEGTYLRGEKENRTFPPNQAADLVRRFIDAGLEKA